MIPLNDENKVNKKYNYYSLLIGFLGGVVLASSVSTADYFKNTLAEYVENQEDEIEKEETLYELVSTESGEKHVCRVQYNQANNVDIYVDVETNKLVTIRGYEDETNYEIKDVYIGTFTKMSNEKIKIKKIN